MAKLFHLIFLLTDPPFILRRGHHLYLPVCPYSRAVPGSPQACHGEGALGESDPGAVRAHTSPSAGNRAGLQARLAEQLQLLFSFRRPLCLWSAGIASSAGQEKCFPECLLSSQAPSRQGLESPGRQRTVISPSCPQPAGDSDLLSAREVLVECTSSELTSHRAIPSCAGP